MKKHPQLRGNRSHYRKLAHLSAQSRIRRHVTCELKLDEKVVSQTPVRKRDTDAGYDLSSAENVAIEPGEVAIIRTGVHVNIPPGYYCTIEGRSSMFRAGLVADRGIIDATYTGEILVHLRNWGLETKTVEVRDRIAQIVFAPIIHVKFEPVDEFTVEPDARGDAGYGSSGK